MGKNIMDERRRAAAKKAKTKPAPTIIKTFAEQQAENEERMREIAQKERARQASIKEKQAKQAEAQRERSEALAQEQRVLAAEALQGERAENPDGGAPAAPRKGPSRGPARGDSAPPRPAAPPPIKWTEFVDPASWDALDAQSSGSVVPDYEELRAYVRAAVDTNILCAPRRDGRIRTWNELRAPPVGSEFDADWEAWLSPTKWMDLVALRFPGNVGNLTELTLVGNYNEVLVTTPGTPVNDPDQWPPQLLHLGVELEGAALHEVLPSADYVIRMTRSDPFPQDPDAPPGARPVYRSMKMHELVDELTYMLHAASAGIGPPVYAATAWPWAPQPGDTQQRFGMVVILQRAKGNMSDYEAEVYRTFPRTSQVNGPRPELKQAAETCASWMAGLCYHIAWTGHINYDMKPGNLLYMNGQSFYATDFDSVYYLQVPDSVASLKLRFFVNMLLLCMHVRGYGRQSFSQSFLAVLTPMMMKIWKEELADPSFTGPGQSGGQASHWLNAAKIAPVYEGGSFDRSELKRIDDKGTMLGRMLSMMVFEYMFDSSGTRLPPPAWPGWDKAPRAGFFSAGPGSVGGNYAPLIPQLLRFSLFYNKEPPFEYARLLARGTA